jgi:hypothetical protein
MLGQTLVTHQTGPEGKLVSKVLIAEPATIAKELYFAILLDRATARRSSSPAPKAAWISSTSPSTRRRKSFASTFIPLLGLQGYQTRKLAKVLGLRAANRAASKLFSAMFKLFMARDCSQIEVNPLVVTPTGELLALDAKFNFDDNALFRQPEIVALRDKERGRPARSRRQRIQPQLHRARRKHRLPRQRRRPRHGHDGHHQYYGGSPPTSSMSAAARRKEQVTAAFKIILGDPNVKGILVNIFGGIMDCTRHRHRHRRRRPRGTGLNHPARRPPRRQQRRRRQENARRERPRPSSAPTTSPTPRRRSSRPSRKPLEPPHEGHKIAFSSYPPDFPWPFSSLHKPASSSKASPATSAPHTPSSRSTTAPRSSPASRPAKAASSSSTRAQGADLRHRRRGRAPDRRHGQRDLRAAALRRRRHPRMRRCRPRPRRRHHRRHPVNDMVRVKAAMQGKRPGSSAPTAPASSPPAPARKSTAAAASASPPATFTKGQRRRRLAQRHAHLRGRLAAHHARLRPEHLRRHRRRSGQRHLHLDVIKMFNDDPETEASS